MKKNNTLFLVEVAIFGALGYLLDLLAGVLSLKIWAQGGSISISMVPVFIMAFRWGIKGGILSGFILGLLQIVTGTFWGIDPVQIFLDYIVAFTSLGFAGVFAGKVATSAKNDDMKKIVMYVSIAAFLGCLLRFLAHYSAGVIYFDYLAPEGQPVWLYSLLYNGSYMLPSFVIATIVTVLLIKTVPRIFTTNNSIS
ncbi:MAG: energy-coupled thiamine transporter ThiT [Bacillota bacterium]|uniref:energy-coupled thiamine transporter ThiT n=1 Tax=Bacillus sp. RO2 TaxID=2723913 RepID=UPI00145E60D1|nr:energy-coupled thiamine transporter ThiT [Bacillus sp. RO2]MEA3320207.1 energy-coupled thiamine transporter ThiT [Bacillota bacterium]NMH71818.1 energy-coupled thiamine transporter ThiT [Bacillus sp. RO2]